MNEDHWIERRAAGIAVIAALIFGIVLGGACHQSAVERVTCDHVRATDCAAKCPCYCEETAR